MEVCATAHSLDCCARCTTPGATASRWTVASAHSAGIVVARAGCTAAWRTDMATRTERDSLGPIKVPA